MEFLPLAPEIENLREFSEECFSVAFPSEVPETEEQLRCRLAMLENRLQVLSTKTIDLTKKLSEINHQQSGVKSKKQNNLLRKGKSARSMGYRVSSEKPSNKSSTPDNASPLPTIQKVKQDSPPLTKSCTQPQLRIQDLRTSPLSNRLVIAGIGAGGDPYNPLSVEPNPMPPTLLSTSSPSNATTTDNSNSPLLALQNIDSSPNDSPRSGGTWGLGMGAPTVATACGVQQQQQQQLTEHVFAPIPSLSLNVVQQPRKVEKLLDINPLDECVIPSATVAGGGMTMVMVGGVMGSVMDRNRLRGYSLGWGVENSPLLLRFSEESKLLELLPPLVNTNNATASGFKVETECRLFNPKTYKLNIQREVYGEQYSTSKHHIWVGSYPTKTDEYFIVTLLDIPSERENLFHGLEHSKKGIEEFEIVCLKKKDRARTFEKALEQHFLSARFYYLKTTPEIVSDLVRIEAKHKLVCDNLEIGVIYAKTRQKNPLDMFLNESSTEFEHFTKNVCTRNSWRGFTVSWHVATKMNEEQHRRLIGNSQCIVFFKDSDGIQFEVSEVPNLGIVPQFFVVVEPYEQKYRLGFFQRTSLGPFGPQLPANFLFDSITLVDYLLTKVHNGYMSAMKCPGPISRLHEEPLAFAIREVVEKYCPKTWLKH